MTNLEFRAWRERCGYSSWVAVAHDLRLGRRTVKSYASGERPVPGAIARLCELIEEDIKARSRLGLRQVPGRRNDTSC